MVLCQGFTSVWVGLTQWHSLCLCVQTGPQEQCLVPLCVMGRFIPFHFRGYGLCREKESFFVLFFWLARNWLCLLDMEMKMWRERFRRCPTYIRRLMYNPHQGGLSPVLPLYPWRWIAAVWMTGDSTVQGTVSYMNHPPPPPILCEPLAVSRMGGGWGGVGGFRRLGATRVWEEKKTCWGWARTCVSCLSEQFTVYRCVSVDSLKKLRTRTSYRRWLKVSSSLCDPKSTPTTSDSMSIPTWSEWSFGN